MKNYGIYPLLTPSLHLSDLRYVTLYHVKWASFTDDVRSFYKDQCRCQPGDNSGSTGFEYSKQKYLLI